MEIRYQDDQWDLILRPMDVADLEVTHNAILETDESPKRFMPWAHYEMTAEDHARLFMKFHAQYYLGVEYHLTCVDAKTGEFVMNFGILPQQRFNRHSVEIGYWTAAKFQNLGIATLGVKIMSAVCFECLDCDRIFATTNVENTASVRILEKCGMQKEGLLKNYLQAPSEKMISDGFSPERSSYIYALFPEDRQRLPWYKNILMATRALSVFGKEFVLKELSIPDSEPRS